MSLRPVDQNGSGNPETYPVEMSQPPTVSNTQSINENSLRLFVGGLKIQSTKESIEQFYSQFGQVAEVSIMCEHGTNKSRGFAFVTFSDLESVNSAQRARPHIIDGKQVDAKRAIPKTDPDPENRLTSCKIFVGGLMRTLGQADLVEYFSKYGEVSECTLVVDKETNQSKGFAFLTFTDADIVDQIILARPHTIHGSRADVKKAVSKEELSALKAKQEAVSYQRYAATQNFPPAGGYYVTPVPPTGHPHAAMPWPANQNGVVGYHHYPSSQPQYTYYSNAAVPPTSGELAAANPAKESAANPKAADPSGWPGQQAEPSADELAAGASPLAPDVSASYWRPPQQRAPHPYAVHPGYPLPSRGAMQPMGARHMMYAARPPGGPMKAAYGSYQLARPAPY